MATYYGSILARSVDNNTGEAICATDWPNRGHLSITKPYKVDVNGRQVTISSNGPTTGSNWKVWNNGTVLNVYWNNTQIETRSYGAVSDFPAKTIVDSLLATPITFTAPSDGQLRIGVGTTSCPAPTAGLPNAFPMTSQSAMDEMVVPINVVIERPPSLNSATITSSNPSVYKVTTGISGIDWGIGQTRTKLTCSISYTLDGISYNYIAATWTDGATSKSITIDGLSLAASNPWSKIPDDETINITWRAETNVGNSSKSKTQYCQMSYTAYVIEQGVNNGNPVEADLYVSNITGQQPNKHVRRVTSING